VSGRKAPDSAGGQQGRDSGGRFTRGHSGNPKGRREGSRNRATIAALDLLEDEGERLTRKAIDLALAGDTTALGLCLSRLLPPARERRVELELPEIRTPADAVAALAAIASAAASGGLELASAEKLGALVSGWCRAFEGEVLARRVAAIEARLKGGRGVA